MFDDTASDRDLNLAIQARIDGKTKPPGSLGRVEDLAAQSVTRQMLLNFLSGRAAANVFAGVKAQERIEF